MNLSLYRVRTVSGKIVYVYAANVIAALQMVPESLTIKLVTEPSVIVAEVTR